MRGSQELVRPEPASEYFRAVVEATADGILVVDDVGRVVTSNRRFAELWNLDDELVANGSDDEMIDSVLEQLVDPRAFRDKISSLYQSRAESLDVIRFIDGRVFARFSAPLIRDDEISGRVWSFRDVTARTQAEAALRESEARFRELYDHSPVMLHAADADGRILNVGGYWLERMGYSRGQVIGRKATDFVTAESRETCESQYYPRLIAEGKVSDIPCEWVTSDGEVFAALFSATAHYDSQGVFVRSFAYVVDISERKRAEAKEQRLERQLQDAQKLESLGVLAGGIAHDFNNLLVAVLGNADLALRAQPLDTPGRELIAEIAGAAQRAAGLCNQLLAYSGKGHFQVRPVDLSELVRDITGILGVSLTKRADIETHLADGLPAVQADVNQLRQVVMNLVTNAGEAVQANGGTIEITSRLLVCDEAFLSETLLGEGLRPGEYVCLEVADNGCGMDGETLQKVFDPFFTTKTTGRGLGLAATLGIVRGHHGTISVRSEVNGGSTFRVFLPPSSEVANPITPEQEFEDGPRSQGLILIVDDEESVRRVAGRMLESGGFSILNAASGDEAVEIVSRRGHEIDAVLLDLTMPGLSGEGTFLRLRALVPDLKVVFSSGFDAQETTDRFGNEALPPSFIQKPYRSNALLAALRGTLER